VRMPCAARRPTSPTTCSSRQAGDRAGLLSQAPAWVVPHACVTADADYGDNPNFLDGLERRDERYVVAIRADFRVAVAGTGDRGLQRVDVVLAARAGRRWRTIRWREGSRGWLAGQFHAVWAWRQDTQGEWRSGSLIGERPRSGTSGDPAYYWSNFPPTMPLELLVEYAHRRHHVERFHQDAKDLLGLDEYQGRMWHGFHRHAALIMLSYSFLVWQEWQHRQAQPHRRGRPRAAFSPRPDRRRCSLAMIHRQVCEELLFLAIEELIRTNRIEEYRPLRN